MKTFLYVLAAIALGAVIVFFWFALFCIIGAFIGLMVLAWLMGVPLSITKNGETIARYRWFKRIQ